MHTVFRDKLPKSLSYPIGLELIRSALAGLSQLEGLRVMFSSGHWPATKFRRSLRDREPYVVLTASYRPARKPGFVGSREMVEHGHFDETWELTIYPTLCELRALARRLLISEGIPTVAAWLRQAHAEVGGSRYRRIELVFDPDSESLDRREHVGA